MTQSVAAGRQGSSYPAAAEQDGGRPDYLVDSGAMENLFLSQVARELSAAAPPGILGLRVMGVAGAAPLTILFRLAASDEGLPSSGSASERSRPETPRSTPVHSRTARPGLVLAVCLDPAMPCLTTLEEPLPGTPAPKNPDGFVKTLSDRLKGASVARVEQLGRDRVARIVFSRGPGNPELVMWVELFGRRPVAVLTESATGLAIASSHEGVRSASGVILHTGAVYAPPVEKNKTSVEALSLESLRQWTEEKSEEEPSVRLSRRIAGLSPSAALELLQKTGTRGPGVLLEELRRQLLHPEEYFVPAVRSAAEETEHAASGRHACAPSAVGSTGHRVSGPPDTPPQSCVGSRNSFDLALFPLGGDAFSRDPQYVVERFDTAVEAVRHCLFRLCDWYRRTAARRLRSDADAVRARLDKLRAALREDRAAAERGDAFSRTGELILARLKEIPRGADSAKLKDIHGEGTETVEVRLDPALSPSENADRYFKKARKAKRAREVLEKRMGGVEHRLRAIEKFLSEVPDEIGPDELDHFKHRLQRFAGDVRGPLRAERRALPVDQDGRRPALQVRPARTDATPASRGRRAGRAGQFNPRVFTTSEGYTVIVGRNNNENDYVTHHLARQEDLWFHAYGVTGSHVILRQKGKDLPSRRAIEEAASMAAYFSKARTSSAVPVVYTQKKFVSKPRGVKPGTAVCTREKTVMAKPVKPSSP